MKEYKIIAITHQQVALEEVGKYHLVPEDRHEALQKLASSLHLKELLYLSTCNRVEFLFVTEEDSSPEFLGRFLRAFKPEWTEKQIKQATRESIFLEGENAIQHLFEVAASLDSLVIGEREIITQVRNAYEECAKFGVVGDKIRLLIKKVIESAKEIFTSTLISKNPVSVVSLAYRKLKELKVNHDARFLIIGAGATNVNMGKYLRKHGFRNFTIFNRSLPNAEKLAKSVGGKAFSLEKLKKYKSGFDVILSCTASKEYMVDAELYRKLNGEEKSRKVIIDLAIPCDIDPSIYKNFPVDAILIESLKKAAEENRLKRMHALDHCMEIVQKHTSTFKALYRARQIENAMRDVPEKVREIHRHARKTVFAKEIESLDEKSRQILDDMMHYLEKKYISVPMKMAKEILLDHRDN